MRRTRPLAPAKPAFFEANLPGTPAAGMILARHRAAAVDAAEKRKLSSSGSCWHGGGLGSIHKAATRIWLI
jgi:hypothetical protein